MMELKAIDKVENISPGDFKKNYYDAMKPLIITGLAKQWPAYNKWNWDYFKEIVGNEKVALYNNVKSDAYTPINTADDYKTFGEYIDMIKAGPCRVADIFIQYFSACTTAHKGFYLARAFNEGICKEIPHAVCGGSYFHYPYAF